MAWAASVSAASTRSMGAYRATPREARRLSTTWA